MEDCINIDRAAIGRKNRRDGAKFELKTRADLEMSGWIVTRWQNNIDLQTDEIIQAKSNKFNSRTTGFPDFLAFKKFQIDDNYRLCLIECKSNGKLDKKEKEKMNILKHKFKFNCFIAYKKDKIVEYREFNEK